MCLDEKKKLWKKKEKKFFSFSFNKSPFYLPRIDETHDVSELNAHFYMLIKNTCMQWH